MRVLLLLSLMILVLSTISFAQEDDVVVFSLNPNFDTEVLGKGVLQLEANYFLILSTLSNPSLSGSAIRYGLVNRVEIFAFGNYNDGVFYRGFIAPAAGIKATLWNEKGFLPQAAVTAHTHIDALASPGYRIDYYETHARVVFEHVMKPFKINYHIGFENYGRKSIRGVYALGFDYLISNRIGTYLSFVSWEEKVFDQKQLNLGGYYISTKYPLGFSIGYSHALSSNDNSAIGLGFAWRILK
jgi:hypothetical protein